MMKRRAFCVRLGALAGGLLGLGAVARAGGAGEGLTGPGLQIEPGGALQLERVHIGGSDPNRILPANTDERWYTTSVEIPVEMLGPKGTVSFVGVSVRGSYTEILTLPDPETGMIRASLLHRGRCLDVTFTWQAASKRMKHALVVPATPRNGIHTRLFMPGRLELKEKLNFVG